MMSCWGWLLFGVSITAAVVLVLAVLRAGHDADQRQADALARAIQALEDSLSDQDR